MNRLALLLCFVSQACAQDFRSGFEQPVQLTQPVYSGDWKISLIGADQGDDWSTDIPDDPLRPNYFNCLVHRNSDPSQFVRVGFGIPSYRGERSLVMQYFGDDPLHPGSTRIQYNIFPNTNSGRVNYFLYLQPNLSDVLSNTSFRQVMEWMESGADYRFNIFIRRRYGALRWIARGERGIPGPQDWEITSTATVQTGQWIHLDCIWRTHPSRGYLILKINGQNVLQHYGRTMVNSSLLVWQPLKIYVGDDREVSKRGSLWQLVDEIYFRMPN